ncbi:hypothetical protein ACFW9X_03435, partial [Streptomyces sp. NPDC059466]
MSPPPPLGRGRKGTAQAFDAALDDAELVVARGARGQGRGSPGRPRGARPRGQWVPPGHPRPGGGAR